MYGHRHNSYKALQMLVRSFEYELATVAIYAGKNDKFMLKRWDVEKNAIRIIRKMFEDFGVDNEVININVMETYYNKKEGGGGENEQIEMDMEEFEEIVEVLDSDD